MAPAPLRLTVAPKPKTWILANEAEAGLLLVLSVMVPELAVVMLTAVPLIAPETKASAPSATAPVLLMVMELNKDVMVDVTVVTPRAAAPVEMDIAPPAVIGPATETACTEVKVTVP